MTEADLFRKYAKEAIRESSKAKSESEMLAFNELALTWAQVQTIPGKGWSTLLRLYSPLEPWFNKTWRPGEIEPV